MPSRPKLLAVALLAAVFVAGAVSGWAVQAWADARDRSGRKGPRAERTVAYLATELELTAAQQDSVRAVFARYRGAMDAVWRDVRPRFDSVRAQVRADIMTHLAPGQQARYRELIARMDERRAADTGHGKTK
jgi:Spy/CpxP family protein refolding chaperone